VGSHFSASFSGAFGRGIVTKKEPAGMTIARDRRKPNFFGTVILPRSSISTTDKTNPQKQSKPTNLKTYPKNNANPQHLKRIDSKLSLHQNVSQDYVITQL
jgi:hypothetical protein